MLLDITHSKIVEDTASASFVQAIQEDLVPKLQEKYGASFLGLQMYEDYIEDHFIYNGEWYYPLTVLCGGGRETLWIRWRCIPGAFTDNIPYAYTGTEPLHFSFAEYIPPEFEDKLAGRSRYFDGNAVPVRVVTEAPSPVFLCGKFSQTFVDEMARQLTHALEKDCSVTGLSASGITLELVFAPGTYMEHTSENVTYRRLLMTDGARTVRDFWIKWERLDGNGAYSSADTVAPENIRFSLGEDVPQKIREREYRFLLRDSADRYRAAMGRKNVTDWRDIVKRAVKRGVLVRIDTPVVDVPAPQVETAEAPAYESGELVTARLEDATERTDENDVRQKLANLLGTGTAPQTEEETTAPEVEEDSDFAKAMAFARETLNRTAEESAVAEETMTEPVAEPEEDPAAKEAEERAAAEEMERQAREAVARAEAERERKAREEAEREAALRAEQERKEREAAEAEAARRAEQERMEREAAEKEAALRAEQERAAREAAEKEAAERAEKERQAREAAERALEEERERLRAKEEELRAAEERMKRELREQIEREFEEREKARMEEEARRTVEIARRTDALRREQEEAERKEQERRAEAEAQLEAQRNRLAEERVRLEKERQAHAEAERLIREETERLAKEHAEQQARLEAERKAREEAERRRREEEERRAREEAERRAREEAERRMREEAERKKREEEERRRKEEAERRAREEAERRIREEAERRVREERERRAKEEAARLEAVRAETARLAEEHRLAEEAVKLEEERHKAAIQKLEEERRQAEEAKAEAERVAKEEAERIAREEADRRMREEAERRAREEAERRRRAEEERRRREEEARREEEDRLGSAEQAKNVVYVSRSVHLYFCHLLDPGVCQVIYDMLQDTVRFYGKEDVYISVRATIVGECQVDLDFLAIPEDEYDLLINMINALGSSNLGISKVVLDEEIPATAQ